ncbi:MAG TPA: hypothetical protein VG734_01905, partial [Lacunisphaera sp.]|nr:hypothetical protein [Lacunisphaera sp.]
MESAYYAFIVIACLIAVHNWRWGIHAGIVIDFLRDPVRKLCDNEPVAITVAGVAVWGVAILMALLSEQAEMLRIFRRYI